jgi:hypothetical protein
MGLALMGSVAVRHAPCRDTEALAPLASLAAPVALRQSRILRTTLESRLKVAQYQPLARKLLKIQFCSVSAV